MSDHVASDRWAAYASLIAPKGKARPWGALALVLPLIFFMLVFYIVPVAAMLLRSVNDPSWSLAHYASLPQDLVFLKVFKNTLLTAVIVTAATLLLGYPVALALSRLSKRGAAVVLAFILLPFWTSILVRSYAWMVLFGRKGVINDLLGALDLIHAPLKLLNTPLAVNVAMIHILLPYMILPIANTLKQIDPSLSRAGSSLGASPFGVLRQVILPLSMPGVLAGSLLVFVLSLGFYITPAMVGGPRDMNISILIAQQINQLNWAYGATLSATLLATTLLILGLVQYVPGVRGAFRLGGR